MTSLTPYLNDALPRFEASFEQALKNINAPSPLQEAILYSTLQGGKRLRPLLTLATGKLFSTDEALLMQIAIAIEMIHAYSLIHDDLPAMDNDTLRRGQPTCHIQFDEATAILAGDALLTESFYHLTQLTSLPDSTRLHLIQLLSHAAGPRGMVGGQMLDILAEETSIDAEDLATIHSLKTGKLIEASILAAAFVGEANEEVIEVLTQFSQKIGLAFQVQDDILDLSGTTDSLGKTAGKDQQQGKTTYATFYGLEKANKILEALLRSALSSLEAFNEQADCLRSLALYIINRSS